VTEIGREAMSDFDVKDVCYPKIGSLITEADALLLQKCCGIADAKTILEIGTKRGGSAIVLAKEVEKRKGRLYCMDPNFNANLAGNLEDFEVDHLIELICGYSPWAGRGIVPDELDMLWIDGDHSILGALADFIYWEPRVRVGGVVAFHDYSRRGVVPKTASVETAVDLILHERKDIEEIGFVGKPDGGTIAFQKTALPELDDSNV